MNQVTSKGTEVFPEGAKLGLQGLLNLNRNTSSFGNLFQKTQCQFFYFHFVALIHCLVIACIMLLFYH